MCVLFIPSYEACQLLGVTQSLLGLKGIDVLLFVLFLVCLPWHLIH